MSEYVKGRVKDHLWSRTFDCIWLRGAGDDTWFRVRCIWSRVVRNVGIRVEVRVGNRIWGDIWGDYE